MGEGGGGEITATELYPHPPCVLGVQHYRSEGERAEAKGEGGGGVRYCYWILPSPTLCPRCTALQE